jgi:hypothetical protein
MMAAPDEGDITMLVISTSTTHVVLGVEISIDFLRRHASLFRQLARLAEEERGHG